MMMRSLVSLTGLLLLALPASGQTVRALVNTDSLSVGSRHRVVMSIVHDGSRQAVFPDQLEQASPPPSGSIGLAGDLELLRRISAGSRQLDDGARLDSVLYEMTTFALDTAFVDSRVGLATELDTALFASVQGFLPVRSVVPDDAEDIRDLAPLAEFPRALWPWILALIVIAAVFWWFFFRKREQVIRIPEPEPEPAEPPFQEAMRRLGHLSREEIQAMAPKPYFVELSDIVRTYLARRTAVPARELTTNELVGQLRKRPLIRAERVDEVRRLLTVADLVKFADQRPPVERVRGLLEEARASIERTEAEFSPPAAATSPETTGPST